MKLEKVPSFWRGLGSGLLISPLACLGSFVVFIFLNTMSSGGLELIGGEFSITVLLVLALVASVWWGTQEHFKVKSANGNRPRENAERQEAYEVAMAAALKAAEPLKAAEDHRLRCQIRELEGLAKTVSEKEADVRRILATL